MDAKTVENLLRAHFEPEDQAVSVAVEGAGAKYEVTVISEIFADQRPVRRQQAVYGALREAIGNGSIHAVNIHAMTPAEAGARGA